MDYVPAKTVKNIGRGNDPVPKMVIRKDVCHGFPAFIIET